MGKVKDAVQVQLYSREDERHGWFTVVDITIVTESGKVTEAYQLAGTPDAEELTDLLGDALRRALRGRKRLVYAGHVEL
jgi:hypothetical protein